MESRGLPIDDSARIALGEEFRIAQEELGREIAALAPEECKRVHPKGGYKGVPPEVKKWDAENPNKVHLFTQAGMLTYPVQHHEQYRDGDDGEFYHYEERKFPVSIGVCDAKGEPIFSPVSRWCRVYDFNPNSSQQLIDYMKSKKHPVPKSRKNEDAEGNAKDTTEKKELVRLSLKTGDKFYLKVIQFREYSKMRGTYLEGFKPGPDGKVHTTFTFDTGIGQLSSRDPNIQNFPKHAGNNRLALAIRRIVAAQPGYVLTEWDLKSCHVLTLGYLAEDENYIRLARLDMHSFVTGHGLKLWDGPSILKESDDDLRARFKWLKSFPEYKRQRDEKFKHMILGIGNGLRAKGLFERYPEEFGSQKEADKTLKVAEQLFPKVFAWQKKVQRLAHEQQFLKTEFGHIRRFYEVFRWDSNKNDWSHGDQAEEAISFWLSNIAFGHIREKLKQLAERGLDEKYGLMDNIHDAAEFHFPRHLLDEHVAEIQPVLLLPSTVLKKPGIAPDGLYIDAEACYGQTWADMHELPLPKVVNGHILAPQGAAQC
jgi:hypothetical protein